MKFSDIKDTIGAVPHMTPSQGELIYNMILDNDIFDILELGIAHGTGSCYMAAALHEKNKGSVTTIDNKSALLRKPDVFELLKKCDLESYVSPIFADSSYNWELMKLIKQQTKDGFCEPLFDFCFIDGAHNFEIDNSAFFLVDKLLKPGGFILFDDVNWTYASSAGLKDTEWVKNMSEDEKTTPHIKALVELIVMGHPNYIDFQFQEDWFLTRKKSNSKQEDQTPVLLEKYKPHTSIAQDSKALLRKVAKKLLGRG